MNEIDESKYNTVIDMYKRYIDLWDIAEILEISLQDVAEVIRESGASRMDIREVAEQARAAGRYEEKCAVAHRMFKEHLSFADTRKACNATAEEIFSMLDDAGECSRMLRWSYYDRLEHREGEIKSEWKKDAVLSMQMSDASVKEIASAVNLTEEQVLKLLKK